MKNVKHIFFVLLLLLCQNSFAQVTVNFPKPIQWSVMEDTGFATVQILCKNTNSDTVFVNIITEVTSTIQRSDINFENPFILKIAPGIDSIHSFKIPIVNDTLIEKNELIMLALAEVSDNAFLGADAEQVIEIIDEDDCKTPTINNLKQIYCISDGFVPLIGSPSNGVFTGDAVANNTFSISFAGLGQHKITYTLNDNCKRSISDTLEVQVCLGIDENEESKYEIYPNPSAGFFYINSAIKNFEVEIYNILGQLIFSEKSPKIINLQNYPSGLYTLQIEGKSQILIKY